MENFEIFQKSTYFLRLYNKKEYRICIVFGYFDVRLSCMETDREMIFVIQKCIKRKSDMFPRISVLIHHFFYFYYCYIGSAFHALVKYPHMIAPILLRIVVEILQNNAPLEYS